VCPTCLGLSVFLVKLRQGQSPLFLVLHLGHVSYFVSLLYPTRMWTTREELRWLMDCLPDYHVAQKTPGKQIQNWLRGTAVNFLEQFKAHPERDPDALVNNVSPFIHVLYALCADP